MASSSTSHDDNNADGGGDLAADDVEEFAGAGLTHEATVRLQQAKLRVLAKQVSQAQEMQKRLQDQVNELQNSLKLSRDMNKTLEKKVSTLEKEQSRKRDDAATGATSAVVTALEADNTSLKKDLAAAERLVKQHESTSRNKDLQLKRALETVDRLKGQVSQMEQLVSASSAGQHAAAAEAVERVKRLEKQRGELLVVFKKQMRLVDVLKRQRVHMEAARLLQFTEEEFMKTLDWAT